LSFLHLQTFVLIFQGEGDVLEAEVHVPSHEGGEEEERHPGVNFINVLRASFFVRKSLSSFFLLTLWL
jgi:hypothetical protein